MASTEYLGLDKSVNKMSPLVSVCVPTYQHAEYIVQCLDGILAQEVAFPIEILIGEDQSSDGTREICISYADKYPDKIRLFLNDREDVIYFDGRPSGRANFLNLLSEARGEFVAICEGDDYWTDNSKLEQQVAILRKFQECSFVFHNASIVGGFRDGGDFSIGLSEGVYGIELIIGQTWFVPTQSILFRKDSLEMGDWIKHIFNCDWGIQLMLAARSPYYYINKIMSVYRLHEKGTSHGRKRFSLRIKQIETLCIFNCTSKFKYDGLIKERIESLREVMEASIPSVESFVENMSKKEKLLTFRYYVYLKRKLVRKIFGR